MATKKRIKYVRKENVKGAKRGALSDYEREFIFNNSENKPDEWIAEQLNRNLSTIKKYRLEISAAAEVKPILETVIEEDMKFRALIRAREDWPVIQKQYTDEEIKLFEFYWIRVCKQLPDMTHTEEMQAIKLIHFEMLMNRTLQAKKKVLVEMQLCDNLISEEMRKESEKKNSGNRELVQTLEEKRALLVADEQTRTKEFTDTMERYNKLMSALKVTRDQRFAKVENSKHNFADWIRIHNEGKQRQREAEEAELSRIAVDNTFKELGKLHRFEDGEIDRPILNAETIEFEDEEPNDGKDTDTE